MNGGSTSNIKQILASYDMAIAIYENPDWVKTVTPEDIKVAFKLSGFVEKCSENFANKGSSEKLLKALKTWRESSDKSLDMRYSFDIFLKMSDHFLIKFFKYRQTSEKILDIATRMYTSLYPKQRLEAVFAELINKSASYGAIVDFIAINSNTVDLDVLKFSAVLNDLSIKYNSGGSNKLKMYIAESLSSFKVQNQDSLPLFIGILSLNTKNEVTQLILDEILIKMLDRSILSNNFWISLVRNTKSSHINKVCSSYNDFLTSLCNFLIYIATMMEKSETTEWLINTEMKICPEINYNELESIFINLCSDHYIKKYVIEKLEEAKVYTNSSIFDEIKDKCLRL